MARAIVPTIVAVTFAPARCFARSCSSVKSLYLFEDAIISAHQRDLILQELLPLMVEYQMCGKEQV